MMRMIYNFICFCVLITYSCDTKIKTAQEDNLSKEVIISPEAEVDSIYYDLENALQNKNNVVQLILREKGLGEVPSQISLFTNLQVLDLSMNPIMNLPSSIFELKELKALFLGNCALAQISSKIENLSELEKLELINNDLIELPSTVCSLRKLKYLNISGNDRLQPPKCIGNLKSLKALWFLSEDGESNFSEKDFSRLTKQLPNAYIK